MTDMNYTADDFAKNEGFKDAESQAAFYEANKTVHSFCKIRGISYHTATLKHTQFLHDENKGLEDCIANLEVS